MKEIKLKVWDTKHQCWWNFDDPAGDLDEDAVDLGGGHVIEFKMPERLKLVQYTGRQDENDVEIYAGDIITLIDKASEYTEKVSREKFGAFIVEWSEHLSGWYPKSLNGYEPDETWWDTWEIMVIGNIYENPELLEGKS
jgi:uncharacterized phage protein (TIGR01671 family)